MITVEPPQQARHADVRPLSDWHESPAAQGEAGRQLKEQYDRVTEHWKDQTNLAIEESGEMEPRYRHVPFQPAGTRRVRYRVAGDLKPRTYSLGEDDL